MQPNSYKSRVQNGLCGTCGAHPPEDGKKSCSKCLGKLRERSKRFKSQYKESPGTCKNCGKPTSKRLCEGCQKAKSNREHVRLEARYKSNMCKCGEPKVGTYCKKCLDKSRIYRKKCRALVFEAYGGAKCNCCGETENMFLTIDHINNDGAEHRRKISKHGDGRGCGGTAMYTWLIRNKFPPGFQVLCANCQLGKQVNGGVCPHKTNIQQQPTIESNPL